MTTPAAHPRDPLHGITLEAILNDLVQASTRPSLNIVELSHFAFVTALQVIKENFFWQPTKGIGN